MYIPQQCEVHRALVAMHILLARQLQSGSLVASHTPCLLYAAFVRSSEHTEYTDKIQDATHKPHTSKYARVRRCSGTRNEAVRVALCMLVSPGPPRTHDKEVPAVWLSGFRALRFALLLNSAVARQLETS
jgi:hypothetical protein